MVAEPQNDVTSPDLLGLMMMMMMMVKKTKVGQHGHISSHVAVES